MGSMASPIGGSMNKDMKRGRLSHVTITPNYDEKGKIKDHTVEAHHENGEKNPKDSWARPEPIKDHPASKDEAMDVAKAHMTKNEDEQGAAGRMSKARSMRDAIGCA